MQSKNKPAPDSLARTHIARIKSMSCGVCEAGGGEAAPSECHEIEQGLWFTSIPLCASCHRSEFNGTHGQARIWKVKKLTELIVLDQTIRRLCVRGGL